MYKLLVVDDERESRNTLCACFPWYRAGFRIVGCCDEGKNALDYILNNPVHAVLCDIKMPIMSGIELAGELYRRKIDIIVVLLSGYRDFEYARQAMMFGVRHYIIKPADYDELMSVFTNIKSELDMKHKPLNPVSSNHSVEHQDVMIKAIQEYILKNYRTATLENTARAIHLNASYLSQLFKNKTGMNFSDYLIEVKMKMAADLLRDIHLKIYEVSEMIGYTNAKNFSRTFRNFFGVSPKEYRNSHYNMHE